MASSSRLDIGGKEGRLGASEGRSGGKYLVLSTKPLRIPDLLMRMALGVWVTASIT